MSNIVLTVSIYFKSDALNGGRIKKVMIHRYSVYHLNEFQAKDAISRASYSGHMFYRIQIYLVCFSANWCHLHIAIKVALIKTFYP